ncbi:MAG: pyridoxamine 5'-phosphate oxidase family protein [Candidatus Parcubacteria bacterium]|nr:pyridoxamine 5'-phosphate oxidase family protein [Burkholderiales bacterium]
MIEALRARVRAMLEAHSTATLATAGAEGPWAAAVFYASDEPLNLYFVTDTGTRHGRDLQAGGPVAAAINSDVADWHEIRGLQLEGRASMLSEAGRAAAMEIYLAKFSGVRRLLDAPRDDSEKLIGERLDKVPLWRLAPSRIRLLDNRKRFGWKQELVL